MAGHFWSGDQSDLSSIAVFSISPPNLIITFELNLPSEAAHCHPRQETQEAGRDSRWPKSSLSVLVYSCDAQAGKGSCETTGEEREYM